MCANRDQANTELYRFTLFIFLDYFHNLDVCAKYFNFIGSILTSKQDLVLISVKESVKFIFFTGRVKHCFIFYFNVRLFKKLTRVTVKRLIFINPILFRHTQQKYVRDHVASNYSDNT